MAAEAARRGTTVEATASVLPRLAGDRWPDARALALSVQKRNIAILNARRVTLAVGSDGISGEVPFATARSDVDCLRPSGLADGLALLRMWAANTPRRIFPNRKIGRLSDAL